MDHCRIVVTGMGAYTPLATNSLDYKKRLNNGESVIRDITDLIPQWYEIEPGNEIPILKTCRVQTGSLFYPEQLDNINFGKDAKNQMCHPQKIGFAAAREAVLMSGLFDNENTIEQVQENTGVYIGTGFGGLSEIERSVYESLMNDKKWAEECERRGQNRRKNIRGLQRLDPFTALKTLPGATASYVSGFYATKGPCSSKCTECGSGLSNIIDGCKDIQLGIIDYGIVGGSGDGQSYLTVGGFDIIDALSKNEPSRPFDRDRKGFVIGDGAGMIVIERLENALKRGANIYGEIVGYGETSDGIYGTGTSEDAEYAAKSIRLALSRARLNLTDIQHVNSHGTSTLLNDWQETKALKKVFGEHAKNLTITANKSMTGHMLNATGALELIVAIQTINDGIVPPTINFQNRDDMRDYHNPKIQKFFEELDLDYVPNIAREQKVEYVLSTNFAFGGRNFAMVVGRFNGDNEQSYSI